MLHIRARVKPDRISWLVSLLFVCCCAAVAQDGVMLPQAESDDGNASEFAAIARPAEPLPPENQPSVQEKPYPWQIAVYPAFAWVPIFGTSIELPPSLSNPIAPSGSTGSSLNGAYFGAARVEKHRWSGAVLFMWAALSSSRETPVTDVGLDIVFGDVLLGRQVLPGLFVEGGFRRIALDINATVGSSSATASPGYWDPLIGLTYRRQFGKKWRMLIHGDGGGFGVGSDVDVSANGRAEWQFARHYGLTMGYGGLHLSDSTSVGRGTLQIRPTLHGPMVGFGLYF